MVEDSELQGSKRPCLFTGLAILQIFTGGSMTILFGWAILSGLELPYSMIAYLVLIFFSLTVILVGVGMLSGKPWGWWVNTYSYFTVAIRSIVDIGWALIFPSTTGSTGGPEYLGRNLFSFVVSAFVIAMLYSQGARKYFGIQSSVKKRSVFVLVALAVVSYPLFLVFQSFLAGQTIWQ